MMFGTYSAAFSEIQSTKVISNVCSQFINKSLGKMKKRHT